MKGITLINGECLAEMKKLKARSIDLCLTDPPYGTTACSWDAVIPFLFMWSRLRRIMKSKGGVILFGAEPFSSRLRMSNVNNFKYDWFWMKNKKVGFANAKHQPMRDVESASVFCFDGTANYFPQNLKRIDKKRHRKKTEHESITSGQNDGSLLGDYIQKFEGYPGQVLKFDSQLKPVHQTQKPIPLLEYLINTHTKEGDTVLDFTMGSGSTGVAAKRLNRKFIGIELDKKYFNIAKKRIEEA